MNQRRSAATFDSPCIDAGTNLNVFVSTDLTGALRPVDGNGDGVAALDMGADEYQPLRFDSIIRRGTNVVLTWFPNIPVTLQRAGAIPTGAWANVLTTGGQTSIEMPLRNTNEFFRLLQP